MASQLREILNRFDDQTAPMSINRMAREMSLEPGVLQGMIDYWVRKGKLREVNGTTENCNTCGSQSGCPFIVAMPRYYELATDDAPSMEPPCACGGHCGT